jgi:hypothetical protein
LIPKLIEECAISSSGCARCGVHLCGVKGSLLTINDPEREMIWTLCSPTPCIPNLNGDHISMIGSSCNLEYTHADIIKAVLLPSFQDAR